MRKLPVALGLLLIFASVIVVSSYNSSISSQEWKTETEVDGKWSISGNFNTGENMTLTVAWSAITYGEDLGELPTNVSIISSNKDTANFTVYFLQNPNMQSGQEAARQRIYVSRIELLSNDGDSLEVDDPPRQIGGIVKQAGAFEVQVHPPPDSFPWAGYPDPQPPDALRLMKVVVNRKYPYRDLLPVGVTFGILGGAVIIIWRDGGAPRRTNRDAIRKKRARGSASRA